MAYQQLHAGKIKLNGLAGMQHHLLDRDRVKTNPDIDLSRSHLNHSIESLSAEHLAKRVHQRIKQLNLKRKPRNDAVAIEDIIIGASVDFMLNLGTEQREKYFADALHFFQSRYGKENVMYCQCHMDESNPHIHIGIIPVTVDDRLSARDVFSPKTLEQLQTDFHRAVSQHYGLERGQSHSKNYLEVNKFKAKKVKQELQLLSHDLHSALLAQEDIDKINRAVHFASNGVLFKTEDKENVELPTNDFIHLRHIAEEGVKAGASILLLKEQIKQLQQEKLATLSEYDFLRSQFNKLDKSTEIYTSVPKFWQKHIDASILHWQKTFNRYCHDVNKMTVRIFLATNYDFDKTAKIMDKFIKNCGIKNVEQHITDVIISAQLQFKRNIKPDILPVRAWIPPKPSETDYKQPDETGIVPLQLSNVPDVDWEMVNWNLLSELDKDEIRHKKILREL